MFVCQQTSIPDSESNLDQNCLSRCSTEIFSEASWEQVDKQDTEVQAQPLLCVPSIQASYRSSPLQSLPHAPHQRRKLTVESSLCISVSGNPHPSTLSQGYSVSWPSLSIASASSHGRPGCHCWHVVLGRAESPLGKQFGHVPGTVVSRPAALVPLEPM